VASLALLSSASCAQASTSDLPFLGPLAPELPAPRGLAVGIDEENANLISPGTVDAAFAPWRDRLAALRPQFARLDVIWSRIQPRADRPPDFDQAQGGCVRDTPPCAPYAGVRAQLRALAQRRQVDGGGWEPYVVVFGAPGWATVERSGCVPDAVGPTGLAVAPEHRAAYGRLIAGLIEAGREEGIPLRLFSAWNEPNQPAFIAPQRRRCDVASPTVSADSYAGLVRALRDALDAAPGDQRIVLGETAGYDRPLPTATGAAEFVRALPEDVVCAGDVWAQHAYVGGSRPGPAADLAADADRSASADLLAELERALDARGCPRPKRIWITETGVGGDKPGAPRPRSPEALRDGCRAMHAALRTWAQNRRVDAAFQYTFREDDSYPVGLVDTALNRAYPTYDLWRAWAARPPGAPAPELPAACR